MTDTTIGELVAGLRAQLTAPGSAFELATEDVRGQSLQVFRHRARTTRELLERSARFGDRTYVIEGGTRLTFADLLSRVDAFAAHLQRTFDLQPGDRVAIHAANRWEWVIAWWAIMTTGAVPAAFNGWWTPEETAHACELVEPVLVLGDAKRLAVTAEAGHRGPVFDLDELASVALSSVDPGSPVIAAADEDDPAELVFTSGTTGRAKAVTIPHRAIVGFAQLNVFNDAVAGLVGGSPVPAAGDEPPPSDEIVLVTSPLFHVSMLHGVVLQAVVSGSAFVLLPGAFDPERVLATIEREKITRWLALGSAGPRVAASDALGRYDTSSVRLLGVGGAPVSPAVQLELRAAFPTAENSLGMGYTSTEAGAVVAGIGGPEYVLHPTATGRATVTTEIELREGGRVHVHSPYLMLGYWNDQAATDAVLVGDGWLDMGDVGRFEGDLLHIDSRARDLILVSAENVSPPEVEYHLEAHPAVAEAAVLAVDDPITGDAVAAVASIVGPEAPTAGDLTDWCRAELAAYKVPTRWFLLRDVLPRTASGKLLKPVLRARIDSGELPETETS